MRFRDWWDDYDTWGDSSLSNFDSFRRPRTSRLIDQHFGTALRRNDLLSSLANTHISTSPRTTSPYYRPWNVSNISRQDSGSTVNVEKDKFQIILDVQQFTPDEITYDIKYFCVSAEINYLFCAVWKPTINLSSSRESTKKNKTSTDSFRGIFQSFPFMASILFDYLEIRHFVRKYGLPANYKQENVASTLSSDGILSISVAMPQIEQQAPNQDLRSVKIQSVGPQKESIKSDDASQPKIEQMN